MPVYNESPVSVFANLLAMARDLEKTGQAAAYDIFVLSDTTNPKVWVEEESVWLEAKKLMPASIGLYYRRAAGQHRPQKRQHRRFLQQMGRALRFYDRARCRQPAGGNDHGQNVAADGSQPRRRHHPGARPMCINRHSLFARIQQFAGKVYGPIVSAGLAYWQVGDSNY